MYMNDGNKTKINLRNKSVFITGVAGFIGSNLAKRLLSTVEDVKVVGLDNMNHYYDVRLKEARLNELEQFENFSFVKGNLADKSVIEAMAIKRTWSMSTSSLRFTLRRSVCAIWRRLSMV